ncbi:protein phosphatase 2C domain-containing protein [Sutcliffiella horikoshii]|uniref:Protein phosphatase 2C domain-containing protein n=1 Tax=Sutcliffiella horikoshii TaxID=79883 RepID=A0A5D4T205_9BACI|nr:protein phosphatase 2C domain-containing protein [Sutcliffiella horikoshii]TYS68294.1 protein phosphatase 2C domain-containing protein [Sutcliffiella horikoshii]
MVVKKLSWVGSKKHFVDEISVMKVGEDVVLGRFGGNSTSGQYKNEDGCLIWCDDNQDWEFVILLDAHFSAESAELVISTIEKNEKRFLDIFTLPINSLFKSLNRLVLGIFQSESFIQECENVQGETACLLVFRKDNYLWWFSIGDCLLLLQHPELEKLGEYQQNHRSFYEWVGKESTFNKDVPCYSTGVKELRTGENHIFMTTDGLVECPNAPYNYAKDIYRMLHGIASCEIGVRKLLEDIQSNNVRDSTTIVSWVIQNNKEATIPSDLK